MRPLRPPRARGRQRPSSERPWPRRSRRARPLEGKPRPTSTAGFHRSLERTSQRSKCRFARPPWSSAPRGRPRPRNRRPGLPPSRRIGWPQTLRSGCRASAGHRPRASCLGTRSVRHRPKASRARQRRTMRPHRNPSGPDSQHDRPAPAPARGSSPRGPACSTPVRRSPRGSCPSRRGAHQAPHHERGRSPR